MNLGVNPMSFSTTTVSRKSYDGVSDQFPAGLRVLVVDDDPTCLRILEKMLKNCLYEVTKCTRAEVALKLLRDSKDGFDIVMSDVHMPDMDGFKLLEHVGLEMDLPVIMMSADDSKNVVMQGVTHGACDYLIKPVRMEALMNIWQHVVRKKYGRKEKDKEQSGSVEDGEPDEKQSGDIYYSSSANEGHNWNSSKKRKDEEYEGDEKDDTSRLKKPRLVWTPELHLQFMAAVCQLGIDKAFPKKILDLMNVPGLTRENVASHLQKYRTYLKRISGQHQGGHGNSSMDSMDPIFGPSTPLHGLDFQAVTASSGQQGPQSLATIQATSLSRPPTNRPAISAPQADQNNLFSFENPRIRFVGGQQQQQHDNPRQVNLLHEIPTNISAQPLSDIKLPTHPHLRTQISNQTVFPHAVLSNVRGQTYASASRSSALVDFSRSQPMDIPGNSNNGTFSLVGNAGISSASNYDVFSSNNRTDEWGLSGFDLPLNTNFHGRLEVAPSVLVQPSGFSSDHRSGDSRIPFPNRVVFSAGGGVGASNNTNMGLGISNNMSVAAGDYSRIKPERLPYMGFENSPFTDQFDQEDLMSAFLRPQEGVAPGEIDFGFDECYHLDNLPV
ncbi:hypothetical protein OROGR_025281 [Orobanche gracilis]